MHISYDDISSRIAEPPIWWLNGVPRYVPFSPDNLNVDSNEAALVHTKCSACGARFDVGVYRPGWGPKRSLRDHLAVYATLEVGDPPNACCGYGASMLSSEIAILEFWERNGSSWRRVPEMERLLDDADPDDTSRPRTPKPAWALIEFAGLRDEYRRAEARGDRKALITMYERVGCERPTEVLNFWEEQRRYRQFGESVAHLRSSSGITADTTPHTSFWRRLWSKF